MCDSDPVKAASAMERLKIQASAMLSASSDMQRQVLEWEEKEARWNALNARIDATVKAMPEIISLDVGGTPFKAAKSTLLRVEGSYFDALLGFGEFKPDAPGNAYFLDLHAPTFDRVLAFLKTGDLSLDDLSPWEARQLRASFDFLKISIPHQESPRQPPEKTLPWVWDSAACSKSLVLSADHRMLLCPTASVTPSSVLGTVSTVVFRVRLVDFLHFDAPKPNSPPTTTPPPAGFSFTSTKTPSSAAGGSVPPPQPSKPGFGVPNPAAGGSGAPPNRSNASPFGVPTPGFGQGFGFSSPTLATPGFGSANPPAAAAPPAKPQANSSGGFTFGKADTSVLRGNGTYIGFAPRVSGFQVNPKLEVFNPDDPPKGYYLKLATGEVGTKVNQCTTPYHTGGFRRGDMLTVRMVDGGIHFEQNGVDLGKAFEGVTPKEGDLFPIVASFFNATICIEE
ncbi:Aste57867_21871 [Aphanomyces stellatus]|uniref:Aste57867_21871 protein n=1 Tax=Aphanomyces stellatus TaxID=120398 RepID=A0A485LIN5_9STRA|nr:hypothetical protein As57867_021802 [Aphanomyces stellatus]VFT98539.1 Aste57867_21871 [Aphanomyces stellatus]